MGRTTGHTGCELQGEGAQGNRDTGLGKGGLQDTSETRTLYRITASGEVQTGRNTKPQQKITQGRNESK